MSGNEKKSSGNWPAFIFFFVALPLAFTFGGLWVGILIFLVGVVALGWSRRYEGPFPTNPPKE